MSDIGQEKQSWLEQVKRDAEEITRARLAVEIPKLEAQEAARVAAKEEITEHVAVAYDGPVVQKEVPTVEEPEVVAEVPAVKAPVAKKGKK